MPRAATQASGAVLAGRYELLREIATGGMAEVWLARAKSIGDFERRVAIKCCHPHLRKDAQFVAMFLDEARLAAKIHHPNVVATLDVVDDPQTLFLVMDFVDGETLQGLVRKAYDLNARVPTEVTLRIVVDALNGLHAAHVLADERGKPLKIVHRDVSPHNVLVGADGVSRISDFGVAKAEARATTTREGQVKGKLGYMAPEQLTSRELDARADLFSMGVVLWEALVGARLFRGDTDVDTATMILHRAVDPPSQRVPELPKALDDVVMRALERDPERRYRSAAEMADAIEASGVPIASARKVGAYVREVRGPVQPIVADAATVATKPTVAEIPSASNDVASSQVRTSRKGVTVAAIAAVIVLGGGGVAIWASRSETPVSPAQSASTVYASATVAPATSTSASITATAIVEPPPIVSSTQPSVAPTTTKPIKPSFVPHPPTTKPPSKPTSTGPSVAPTGTEYHPSSL